PDRPTPRSAAGPGHRNRYHAQLGGPHDDLRRPRRPRGLALRGPGPGVPRFATGRDLCGSRHQPGLPAPDRGRRDAVPRPARPDGRERRRPAVPHLGPPAAVRRRDPNALTPPEPHPPPKNGNTFPPPPSFARPPYSHL